jgi:hypothetical protein
MPFQGLSNFAHKLLERMTISWLGVDSKKNIMAPTMRINLKNPTMASFNMIFVALSVSNNENRK